MLIRKGEEFFDEYGLPYCTARRDIALGDLVDQDDFEFMDGNPRLRGEQCLSPRLRELMGTPLPTGSTRYRNP